MLLILATWAGDILTNELRVTCYEFICLRVVFIARASYVLHTSYELLFIARVMSCFLHTSYEILSIPRVTRHYYCTGHKLLFIAQVTSNCLLHELRVTSCIRVKVTFYMRFTSYFLAMSIHLFLINNQKFKQSPWKSLIC